MNTPQIPGVPPAIASNKKTLFLVLATVVIVALGIGGYAYWKRSVVPVEQAPDLTGGTVEEILPELNVSANPYAPVAETNPVEKTNPFAEVKTNPFE